MEKRKLDMSLGNPLHPFRSVARYAFQQAAKDLNIYRFLNRGHSDPEVRAAYISISDHFTARGIKPPGWSGLSFGHFTMTGGGTTEGYNLLIKFLAEDVADHNKRSKRDIKPAILMPVPTYGFFMDPAERTGIKPITFERNLKKGGHVTRAELIAAVKKAHEDGYRIVAYFDSNPNNPLGTIRGERETKELAEVFIALREHYRQKDGKELSDRMWDGPASRVRIIDDMVYDGLEYGDKKAFGFAQIPELFDDTFTLAGPSKAGLVSIRGGVIIGHDRDISDIERMRMESNYFPARPTLAALEAFYSVEDSFVAAREKHMNRMNRDHRFNGLFMKALINGIDTLKEATEEDKRKIINTYARLEKCPKAQAQEELQRKIKGIKVITKPEAGFFHLVDFSALRGGTYQSPRHHWKDKAVFKDHFSLVDILSLSQNIGSCSAAWMGMGKESLITRATYAIPLEDILEYTKRLRAAAQMIKAPSKKACCTASDNAPTL